jgi:single-stranded-DNA-specific exonuclease
MDFPLLQPWTMRDVDVTVSQMLADSCGLELLVAYTLVARGITTTADAEAFLRPSLERDWSDPALIPGMTAVADALEKAIRAQKRILVFGDFDVDGISATACMLRGLAALGVSADSLIPNRMDEGYGLTDGVLERIYKRQPELLITVDCGISDCEQVAQIRSRGIEVLVTDHHEPSDRVPQDIPVADPKLVKDSPQAMLAGVGVALKLIALLGERFGHPRLWRDLTDLAALGTLADIMPLLGENRALVAEGIRLLGQSPRPGISSVLALAKRGGQTVSSTDLSFSLIPRLNAAGRMGDPARALELLMDDDPLHAQKTARALDAANSERRLVESVLLDDALAQIETTWRDQKIIIVAGENWHEGVRGIVASRLVSRYGVPAIVFSLVNGEARGSGRSVGRVNLFAAVERCADLTLRFGGHDAAVGATIPSDALDVFRERMEAIMRDEPEENFRPPRLVDARLALSDLSVEAIEQLALLEPYGQDNREPLFATCGVFLKDARAVGAQKNHLSFKVTDGRGSVQAIWFQCPSIASFTACNDAVDVIYRLQVDEFNGIRRVKLMVEQIYRSPSWNSGVSRGDAAELRRDAEESRRGANASSQNEGMAISELAARIAGAPLRLHPAQTEALEALEAGESVLAIMATGRGKSLIFQTHAARLALTSKKASVFIYPLRALIADQYVHAADSFARLGLKVCSLTGENTTDEKDKIFQGLYEGDVDVLLTTPEFFRLHAWRFAQSMRVGFIVFDEAHHIQTERASGRESYHDLSELRTHFPDARYLAVTATADDRITGGIRRALGIERIIVDDSRRDNLRVDDARNFSDRERYLVSLAENDDKIVVYVNSRAQAVELVRLLRKHGSGRAESVVFYHAGLTRAERRVIEKGFRSGELRVIVSTSAFGEGVNVPDITHVVLYNLPFSAVAFNQMSGRAGRGGQEATVHLLYTVDDAKFNQRLLAPLAPEREELVTLYRVLRAYAQAARNDSAPSADSDLAIPTPSAPTSVDSDPSDPTSATPAPSADSDLAIPIPSAPPSVDSDPSVPATPITPTFAARAPSPATPPSFRISLGQLVRDCKSAEPRYDFDERGISNGLAIFGELGLLWWEYGGLDAADQTITLAAANKKVELSASSRYLEGRDELALFEEFKQWAFQASAEELREQVCGPLTPSVDGYVSNHD